MKRIGTTLIATMMLCVAIVGTSLANGKDRRKVMTLSEEVVVNDTLLKKGTYEVRFDAKNNEVHIMKDGDVKVKTKATVELRDNKAAYNSASFTNTDKGKMLTSLTFEGDRRVVLIGDMANRLGDNGQ